MHKYKITLNGCDDSTTIEMELTAVEMELVNRICVAVENESEYGCQPTMAIEEVV